MVEISNLISELKLRNPESHKGDYGKDLIVAGSELMAGAAILASRAALRSGAGLIYISCEKEMYDALHIAVPEAVLVDRSLEDLNKYDAILIGPGLGNTINTRDLLIKVLENFNGKVVIDADAINVISEYDLYDEIKSYKNDIVLTPHFGEAIKLAKTTLNRDEMADFLVKLTGKTICLKGNNTIVKDKDNIYINKTGNPGMATAGMGDVLSGIMVSLIGQNIPFYSAVCLSTYIHGMSGDNVKSRIGEDGLISSDVVEEIPNTLKFLKER